jgi:hypothetical protein
MKHIVLFSGGVGSWAAARRIEVGPDDELILLFTDTKDEHPDLYRWLPEAAANIGGTLVWLKQEWDGLWDLFRDKNFIGNTRVDICSDQLKRKPARKWVNENCDPNNTTIYIGIDWTEAHRFDRASPHWKPYTLVAPLIEPPFLSKSELLALIEEEGMVVPLSYRQGFSHNNCGGFCVKQGHGGFLKLLRADPDTFAYHEEQERQFRERTGKDVAVLRDRSMGESVGCITHGVPTPEPACPIGEEEDEVALCMIGTVMSSYTKPFTLEAFRLKAEQGGEQVALFEADTSCAECML